jgi:hypothetical protein
MGVTSQSWLAGDGRFTSLRILIGACYYSIAAILSILCFQRWPAKEIAMPDPKTLTDSELAAAMTQLMQENRARRWSPRGSRHWPLRQLQRLERFFGLRRHEPPLDWPNGLPMLRSATKSAAESDIGRISGRAGRHAIRRCNSRIWRQNSEQQQNRGPGCFAFNANGEASILGSA